MRPPQRPPSFSEYYRLQRIVPEEEWASFEAALETPLPLDLRVSERTPLASRAFDRLVAMLQTETRALPWAGPARRASPLRLLQRSALAPRWTLPLPKGESAAPPRSRPTFSPAGVSEQCHRLGRRVQHSDGRGPFKRSHEFPAACGKRIR